MATFRQLRADRRFDDALKLLIRCCGSSHAERITAALRSEIFGSRCLILDWAANAIQEGRRVECGKWLDEIRQKVLPLTAECGALFEARLALIEAITGPSRRNTSGDSESDQERLEKTLESHAIRVQEAWNYKKHDDLSSAERSDFVATLDDPLNGPSFLPYLGNDRVRRLFHDMAGTWGWTHPGLLLAGETLAALEGHYDRADFKTTSWIMFASEVDGRSTGILARLTVERLPQGRGLLVPDPFGSAYHLMTETFSTGLQHAWLANRIAGGKARNYDWRWRIDLEEATRKTPLSCLISPEMNGRSAEGALTCALAAAGRGEELDRNTCMSARLKLPIQSTLEIDPIEGLDVKTLSDRLGKKKIRDIIVSDLQTDLEIDTGSDHNFIQVRDIGTAKTHFGVWPKMTRAVKQGLYDEATRLREKLCGAEVDLALRKEQGRAYIRSPISVRPPIEHLGSVDRPPKPVPLTNNELKQFAYGLWRPKDHDGTMPVRLRLFADSGMGKTVQLVVCEQNIARRPDSRVPIRLGKTTGLRSTGPQIPLSAGWTGDLDRDLKHVLEAHLKPHIPDKYAKYAKKWIRRMADLGQLYFVLDGVDQTRGSLENLAMFLKKVPRCPTIVAGRPESLVNRGELFVPQSWTTLELQKLNASTQRRYLGTTLAEDLIPQEEQLDYDSHAAERRKHNWKDLLGVPLLISFMKELARRDSHGRNQLDDIPNRFILYENTVRRLLKKGLKTIEGADLDRYERKLNQLLGRIAFNMVWTHNFDLLDGEAFAELQDSMSEKEFQDLIQADILTEHAILERIERQELNDESVQIRPGLEWRHRSFLEYFAGRELAKRWREDPDQIRALLRDVHDCLDQNGRFRVLKNADVDPQTTEHFFRNLPADWQWTFRFLLAELPELHRTDLAMELISLSNPWIVYESLDGDGVEYREEIEQVVRWLVHRNWLYERDYSAALKRRNEEDATNHVTRTTARASYRKLCDIRSELTTEMLSSRSRDAGLLSSLREVATSFGATSSVWTAVTLERDPALKEYLDESRWVRVVGHERYSMSDFPVTNAVFESFCASHRRFRDQFSREHDQPALYVSWYMAREFSDWLGSVDPGHRYFLPDESVWYAACQWDRNKEWDYWWGPKVHDALCWYGGYFGDGPAKELQRTRSRSEAVNAHEQSEWHPSGESRQRPGLLDMSGNVWQWCENLYNTEDDPTLPGSSRVLRGGSWNYVADVCRSAFRDYYAPRDRNYNIGFRLCRE